MENAKAEGKRIGRPQVTKDCIPAVFYRHDPACQKSSRNVSKYARVCHLSRTTIYKYISLLDG